MKTHGNVPPVPIEFLEDKVLQTSVECKFHVVTSLPSCMVKVWYVLQGDWVKKMCCIAALIDSIGYMMSMTENTSFHDLEINHYIV